LIAPDGCSRQDGTSARAAASSSANLRRMGDGFNRNASFSKRSGYIGQTVLLH